MRRLCRYSTLVKLHARSSDVRLRWRMERRSEMGQQNRSESFWQTDISNLEYRTEMTTKESGNWSGTPSAGGNHWSGKIKNKTQFCQTIICDFWTHLRQFQIEMLIGEERRLCGGAAKVKRQWQLAVASLGQVWVKYCLVLYICWAL